MNCRAVKLGLTKKAQRGDQNPVWIAIKEICAGGVGRTVHELADATGEKHANIERLFYVRRDMRQAHIVDYEPVARGTSRPMWLPVPGVDVPRGSPSAAALEQKVRRALRKTEYPDKTPAWTRRVKVQAAPRVIAATQHPLMVAFYGLEKST